MQWTNDKPTRPGWYWYRDDVEVDVIHLVGMADGSVMVQALTQDDPRDYAFLNGQWAGPIPQPSEVAKPAGVLFVGGPWHGELAPIASTFEVVVKYSAEVGGPAEATYDRCSFQLGQRRLDCMALRGLVVTSELLHDALRTTLNELDRICPTL